MKKVKDFSNDHNLIEQLYELTRPSYVDNSAVLIREIKHCSEIYLLYKVETLVAFFMVNFEKVGALNTFYLGLSGCHKDFKGVGFAKLLYNTFFIDCKHKEKEVGSKILCWWTTATPIPFKWFNDNIEKCEPNLNGDVSEFGRHNMIEIRKLKYSHIPIDFSLPFILKGVAEHTNYSISEKLKLQKVQEELKLKAFERYPIDETKGDRYLMIGFVPELEVLKQRVDGIATYNSGFGAMPGDQTQHQHQ
ncbi:MAG: hypothetical protein J7502_01245 [Flavisolibacter sp.]|nr:hypothetical protein [Flavisolibacter sp.]